MIKYPFLTALCGRGGTTWTGAPLSWLQVEAKGERLYISGTTPLVDDGERFIQNGAAYSYMLEGEDRNLRRKWEETQCQLGGRVSHCENRLSLLEQKGGAYESH